MPFRIALLGVLIAVVSGWAYTRVAVPSTPPSAAPADSAAAERDRYMGEVLATIAGREDEPAGVVFDNVEVLAAVPAGRFVRIMNLGFGRSLGVSCTHCHVAGDWAAEDSTAKQIARRMIEMTNRINAELLPAVEGLRNERPTVNCTTCHRGAVRPALDLPGSD